MNTAFLLLAISIMTVCPRVLFAQGGLSVTVTNIRAAKGTIMVGLFDNKDDFMRREVRGRIVRAHKDTVVVVFAGLPAGRYAISVVHDENDNSRLDANLLGIPTEGFGFGNNAMGMFGPPSFEKAVIDYKGEDVTVGVKMRYF